MAVVGLGESHRIPQRYPHSRISLHGALTHTSPLMRI